MGVGEGGGKGLSSSDLDVDHFVLQQQDLCGHMLGPGREAGPVLSARVAPNLVSGTAVECRTWRLMPCGDSITKPRAPCPAKAAWLLQGWIKLGSNGHNMRGLLPLPLSRQSDKL